MKPYVICHMAASIDGRILPRRWRPQVAARDLYERLHEELAGQAWLVGRISGQEFAKAEAYATEGVARFPRNSWFARRDAPAYAVVLDAHGKIAWGRSDVGGDPIVVILTAKAPDSHLAGLRADGVSYIFAGDDSIDLRRALEILNEELGIERLLLEGGGVANGAFLREGLVDEVSLALWPAVDGGAGAPSVFDSAQPDVDRPPLTSMRLLAVETPSEGVVWLRYKLENA